MQQSPDKIESCRLRFKDFSPERLQKSGLFSKARYQSLADLLLEIEDWRKKNPNYRIAQVETVVLPNKYHWHQFFRVWYEAK